MPTKKATVPATNVNLLKAAVNEYSLENRLSTPTEENLAAVFDDMMNIDKARNALVPSLMQRIGMQTVDSDSWDNPFNVVKKDPMYYGSIDEETYVNFAKSKGFDPREDYAEAFKQYQSYIMTMFHRVNFAEQYPATISYDNMRDAFTSEYGVRDLMRAKAISCVSGFNWDEYNAINSIIGTGYEKQILPATTVAAPVDEATSKKMISLVKAYVKKFRYPKPEHNIAGATSHSRPKQLLWLTTPENDSNFEVFVEGYAFNENKVDLQVSKIVVDEFPDPAIQGVLVDIRFFRIREQFRRFSYQELATSLNWNMFYTVKEMISASPFYPIMVFTTDQVATGSLTITAENVEYTAGTEMPIPASVTGGTGTYHMGLIDYTITSGATSRDTYILPGTNILVLGSDETGTINIDVTYRLDTSVKKAITATKKADA